MLAGVRSATRTAWLPTAVGVPVAVLGMAIAYGAPPGRPQLVPSGESLSRLGALVRSGLQATYESRPPAEPTLPLEVLVVGGALVVMLAVDLIALGLGAPAWSGVAMAALWVPPLMIGRPAGVTAFVGTASAYLLLLAVTAGQARGARRTPGTEGRGRRAVTAMTTSGVVVGAASSWARSGGRRAGHACRVPGTRAGGRWACRATSSCATTSRPDPPRSC